MFKTIKVGVRVHMYSYKDLSSWKPHGLLTCLFYLLSRCAGLKTTLKYSNNSTDVIIDSDGELFMYRYCIKVEGEDLLTKREGGEEEKEVNVLVLVWREYEESVCKVRASLEPKYKHTGGNYVCTP